MAVVYRIQDKSGRGPFKPGFSESWVQPRQDHENLTPWFVEFGRIDNHVLTGQSSGSACKSLEQLRRWFTKTEYKRLKKQEYSAVKMEANILAESDKQCFIVRNMPLNEKTQKIKLY